MKLWFLFHCQLDNETILFSQPTAPNAKSSASSSEGQQTRVREGFSLPQIKHTHTQIWLLLMWVATWHYLAWNHFTIDTTPTCQCQACQSACQDTHVRTHRCTHARTSLSVIKWHSFMLHSFEQKRKREENIQIQLVTSFPQKLHNQPSPVGNM